MSKETGLKQFILENEEKELKAAMDRIEQILDNLTRVRTTLKNVETPAIKSILGKNWARRQIAVLDKFDDQLTKEHDRLRHVAKLP